MRDLSGSATDGPFVKIAEIERLQTELPQCSAQVLHRRPAERYAGLRQPRCDVDQRCSAFLSRVHSRFTRGALKRRQVAPS